MESGSRIRIPARRGAASPSACLLALFLSLMNKSFLNVPDINLKGDKNVQGIRSPGTSGAPARPLSLRKTGAAPGTQPEGDATATVNVASRCVSVRGILTGSRSRPLGASPPASALTATERRHSDSVQSPRGGHGECRREGLAREGGLRPAARTAGGPQLGEARGRPPCPAGTTRVPAGVLRKPWLWAL